MQDHVMTPCHGITFSFYRYPVYNGKQEVCFVLLFVSWIGAALLQHARVSGC